MKHFVITFFAILFITSFKYLKAQDILTTDKAKNIFSLQATVPDIGFKNSAGSILATFNDESINGLHFGSLSLTPAARTVTNTMDNKIWINSRGDLMFNNSPLAGWWNLSGSTLTFPTGLMVIGTSLNPSSTPVLNVLGRATLKSLKLDDGNQAAGKILVSDANGVANWQDLSNGGSIDDLFDGKTTQSALYLGLYAGNSDDPEFSSKNVGIGNNALTNVPATAQWNTAVGYNSMYSFTLGNNNTAIGYEALKGGDSGPPAGNSENTAIGSGSLRNNSNGSGNVAIGFEAGKTSSGDDKLYIHNSDAGESSLIYGDFQSAQVTINGKLRVTQGIYGSLYDISGWPSDIRYKKNIESMTNSLNKVLKLRSVYYDWRKDQFPNKNFNDRKQIGVIAQEIEEVIPEIVFTDEDGFKSVDYSKITAVLINAIQEQQEMIENLKSEINILKTSDRFTNSKN
ncbi:MAG: tail fiber domain-containing protein [Ignavibacteriales bacterium]|nr:tail fiber domain-containing protein [Ignavibacteriales bacterium]MCB9260137.1 tail fiber domain-containing protein [Ignavibacteriales bacterium]